MATEWAMIAQTFGEARDVMLDGPSGFIHVLDRHGLIEDVDYSINRSSWQLTLRDGQKIHILGAKDKDVGRGLNLSGAWLDEYAKWRWSYQIWTEGLAPALRIGKRPRVCVTTTPKPTCKMLREWSDRKDGSVHVTTGSTFDNRSNLSKTALHELFVRYDGTRIGRQELYGELIDDVEGALWTPGNIEDNRIFPEEWDCMEPGFDPNSTLRDWIVENRSQPFPVVRRRWRTFVAVDPPGETAECGIVVGMAPIKPKYGIDHCIILDDSSMAGRPEEWGQAVVAAYKRWGCERAVVEKNQGGDMVRSTIHAVDSSVVVEKVTASDSKGGRAGPVSALYEKNLIHHVGIFPKLEDQMTTWVPIAQEDGGRGQRSPDRLDALVHLVRALMPDPLGRGPARTAQRMTTRTVG